MAARTSLQCTHYEIRKSLTVSAANVSGFQSTTEDHHVIWWNPDVVPELDNADFDLSAWQQKGSASANAGRGSACKIELQGRACFLRHYRRGGLIGKLLHDQYLWLGAGRTRVVREMAITQKLYQLGLPAPLVIGGRLSRSGLTYRCDLITQALPVNSSMAEALTSLDLSRWAQIGHVIAQFHAAGLWHADLNAHNIQLSDEQAWLIDFDRAVFKTPELKWQQANLQRLLRSVCKVSGGENAALEKNWAALLAAYNKALQSKPATLKRET